MAHNNNNMVNDQRGPRVSISSAVFSAKYRSKREVFNFLAVDANVYLPAYGKYPTIISFHLHCIFVQESGHMQP